MAVLAAEVRRVDGFASAPASGSWLTDYLIARMRPTSSTPQQPSSTFLFRIAAPPIPSDRDSPRPHLAPCRPSTASVTVSARLIRFGRRQPDTRTRPGRPLRRARYCRESVGEASPSASSLARASPSFHLDSSLRLSA